jgi:signal transduction histidine kinase
VSERERTDAPAEAVAALALIEGLPSDTPTALLLVDADDRVILASPTLAVLSGGPPGVGAGPLTALVPEDTAAQLAALARAVRREGRPATCEIDVGHPDGRPRHWQVTVRRLEVDGEVLAGLVVTDATRGSGADASLLETERQLETAQRIARMGWWIWALEPRVVVVSPALAALMGSEATEGFIEPQDAWIQRVIPEHRTAVEAEFDAAVREQRPLHVRCRTRQAGGVPQTLELRATPVIDAAGEVTALQGFTQDVTRVERANGQQRALAALGRVGLGGNDLEELLERTCGIVRDALEVEFASIHELSPAADALHLRSHAGDDSYRPRPSVPIDDRTLPGHAVATRAPIVVDDWRTENRFRRSRPAEALGESAAASVPVDTPRRQFGALTVHTVVPRPFSEEDITFLQGVAHVLGEAIARREAAEAIAALSAARGRLVGQALDAEARARRGISERLHDGPLQDLLAAGHDLYGLGDGPAAREAQERLRAIARDLREAMVALHPTVLRYGGLGAALQAIAEQYGRRSGFTTDVVVDDAATGLRDELVLSLARQLLAHAAQSAPMQVTLSLRRSGDDLHLEVTDDGEGGVDSEVPAEDGGLGIATATERATAVGGRLEAGPEPDGGTRVVVVLPLT